MSFLGLINYLQPFIPTLSTKTTSLHKQPIKWDWNLSMDAAFQHLKAWISQTLLNTSVVYYYRSKPVIVQMDASKYGLGAALIQSGHLIAFASKTLLTLRLYMLTLRGSVLSVCFSLMKFHTYLFGRHVIVQNNHKPLEMIQQKPIHVAHPTLSACFYTCKNMTVPWY